ncbi:outer membrane protein assembly factor BamA [Vibrio cincinnatiensis]|jgi:outer membrane protein insertion porin family|uniref:Outer membrane protein assembly factor BamA n=1 Tax=Vibrio cincinnatiensis DSM 19608 TaxID=1123491 RepID=A0A1T4MPC6_VIBCI|nr:outer membrane protein assembly factor BamA [Vibrio cincinnatiensis]MCG3722740.1 outer membrane protein assembly factor BamA [Vibrio cincinnatiensis]MCG3732638.1 outer membrane protein assembly factor BamA [Vibrio cincinnatiensis]MCG3736155.1 outer membrane protein assembly factor BamA [Vibrio cincinnatiensis]MCG3738627.1 outer membrane protein assembly factor BamA [Vibrio cincinnatiensis]MCG3744003.1 outer membrane protein assembly factor BamA [Vibrio cincinnatiensis]
MAIKKILLATLLATSVSVNGAEKFVVQDIQIQGLQRVALGAALLRMPVRIGDTVDSQDVAQIIQALYASGNFEDIRVLRDGSALVVQVQERPTIASVSFSGNKAIKQEQLQQNLEASGIRVGEALDRTTLSNIEKGLEDFYYSVGKYNANVKAVVTPLPRNRADLKFVFNEGVSAKIQQINFIGNEVFSNEELLSRFDLNVDLSWWNFLSDDKYQKQVLAADIEGLRTFYLDRGYLKFRVESTQVSISPDKKGVYITLNLNEGLPYTVKDVQFRGELIGKEQELRALIPFEMGDTYQGSSVTQLEEGVKRVLGEAGYAYPQVQTIPEFDDETQEVSLLVHVEAGKRMYVRDIRFIGNNTTRDEVLRREMRQMEGSWLNSRAIDTGKARLNRLGFFETVDVQTVRVPGSDDQVDLVYSVKEANSGSINFGVGYGTESGVSFTVGLTQDNFMGSGDRVSVSATTNDYQQNVTLEYRDPYWNIDGVSLGGRVFYNKFEASEAGIVDYTNQSYGTGLTWGFPFDELNRFEFGVGYTHNKIGNLTPYLQVEQFLCNLGDCNPDNLITDDFDINVAWTRNNLNRGYFPTAGNHQRAFAKMTVPGSDAQYFKLQYDVRQYIPLTKKHEFTLLLRGRLGYGNGYGKTDGKDNLYPFYENFYAGGFTTLRGFGSNSAGPKAVYRDYSGSNNGNDTATDDSVGGNAIALASMELIVPTPFASDEARSQVRTSLFIDMASVWDTEFDYRSGGASYGNRYYYDYSDPSKYRSSYGVALQWMSPMGPLVFSLAKPIKKYDGDNEEFFTFTIGRTF